MGAGNGKPPCVQKYFAPEVRGHWRQAFANASLGSTSLSGTARAGSLFPVSEIIDELLAHLTIEIAPDFRRISSINFQSGHGADI
jgi:hypothetical protein